MLKWLKEKLTTRQAPAAEQQLAAISGVGDFLTPLSYKDAESSLPAVVACVEYIVSSLSSLKMQLVRRDGSSKEIIYDHPIAELLRDPHPQLMGSSELLSLSMMDLLAYGNSIITIDTIDGKPVLSPIPWGYITCPYREYSAGYRVTYPGQDSVALPSSRVIHLRIGAVDGGFIGRPILGRSQEAVSLAKLVEKSTRSLFSGNGIYPTLAIKSMKPMNPDTTERARTSLEKALGGSDNFGKAMFLPQDFDLEQISPNAHHQELLSTREWHFTTICAVFQVPPQLVGYGRFQTLANFETALKSFAYQPLGRYVRLYGDAFTRRLLPDDKDLSVELDHKHLLQSRAELVTELTSLVEKGIIEPKEAKRRAGYG